MLAQGDWGNKIARVVHATINFKGTPPSIKSLNCRAVAVMLRTCYARNVRSRTAELIALQRTIETIAPAVAYRIYAFTHSVIHRRGGRAGSAGRIRREAGGAAHRLHQHGAEREPDGEREYESVHCRTDGRAAAAFRARSRSRHPVPALQLSGARAQCRRGAGRQWIE